MSDPRTWYGRLAEAADQVLQALEEPGPARPSRRTSSFRSRVIRDRLQRQKEVLRRLQEGEVQPEEALVLLLEEESPAAPAPEYGSYLSRMEGDLRRLGSLPALRAPGGAEASPEVEPPEEDADV